MARCADRSCRRWRPDLLVGRGWGATVDESWYCSRACVARELQRRLGERRTDAVLPSMPPARLGAVLKARGVVPPAFVDRALEAQQEGSRLKLGEQLHAMGVDPEAILAALAIQSGARCLPAVDPQTVREAPGGFNPATVRAIGLVPLSRPEKGHIRVATAAPVPRRALNALRVLAGLVPEAYLVTDDNFAALVSQYGADGVDASANGFFSSDEVEVIADHIAGLACDSRAITIQEAWLDGERRWLRVRGADRLDDVVLLRQRRAGAEPPVDTSSRSTHKEASCLVATTSR